MRAPGKARSLAITSFLRRARSVCASHFTLEGMVGQRSIPSNMKALANSFLSRLSQRCGRATRRIAIRDAQSNIPAVVKPAHSHPELALHLSQHPPYEHP
jgi:hypothetical protein